MSSSPSPSIACLSFKLTMSCSKSCTSCSYLSLRSVSVCSFSSRSLILPFWSCVTTSPGSISLSSRSSGYWGVKSSDILLRDLGEAQLSSKRSDASINCSVRTESMDLFPLSLLCCISFSCMPCLWYEWSGTSSCGVISAVSFIKSSIISASYSFSLVAMKGSLYACRCSVVCCNLSTTGLRPSRDPFSMLSASPVFQRAVSVGMASVSWGLASSIHFSFSS